ncbi:MAG: hypothetical protein ABIN36_09290 [Ferruginibacter sp.]
MKRTNCLFTLIACMCFIQTSLGKTWRVNNASNYNAGLLYGSNLGGTQDYPVFKQINQAVAYGDVTNGDTIHVEGATAAYDNAIISKRLVIIGPGYFLDENPQTAVLPLEAKILNVSFLSTSAGSEIMGMHFSPTANNSVSIYAANDIVIRRCRIDAPVWLDDNLISVYILQNFFPNYPNPLGVTYSAISNGNIFPTNLIFNNNIVQRPLVLQSLVGNITFTIAECRNNVFDGPPSPGNPALKMMANSFQNNILKTLNATVIVTPAQNISFNIGNNSNQFGNSNNNLVVPDMTTIFVDPATNSTDGDYQLKTGLPSNYLGADNTDRGAFGGLGISGRYTLSGLAPIPVTYQINTSGISDATGLPVIIKARTIQ